MTYVIAQLSDTHVGDPGKPWATEHLRAAVDTINAMTRVPDLVLHTGDITHEATAGEWTTAKAELDRLVAPWVAIAGNHDAGIDELAGHRSIDAGPLRLVLLDGGSNEVSEADAAWLDAELTVHRDRRAVIALHAPPFETGIWWMDVVGLRGAERVEAVVRRHPHVERILSGHIHRAIQSNWGACVLWVCPSTSVTIAADLDPAHDPAETAEAPQIGLHAVTTEGIVSHLVPVGPTGDRTSIAAVAGDFVEWARSQQRTGAFA